MYNSADLATVSTQHSYWVLEGKRTDTGEWEKLVRRSSRVELENALILYRMTWEQTYREVAMIHKIHTVKTTQSLHMNIEL